MSSAVSAVRAVCAALVSCVSTVLISMLCAHCLQDGRAAYLLSNVYEMGVGVERSRDRAVRFLTLAAKARYPPACTALAITLEEVRVQPISFSCLTAVSVEVCWCIYLSCAGLCAVCVRSVGLYVM